MSSAYAFLYQEDLYQASESTLILVNQPWETISDPDKTLLSKILGSVKVSVDQVTILQVDKTSLAALHQYNPLRVIAFGSAVSDSEALYHCQKYGNTTLITSDSLSALDDVKKKNLWAALKQMFA